MDGTHIRAALKAKGLKQVDLAGRLGMAPNKLTKALNGERRFTIAEMDVIREYLFADKFVPETGIRAIPVIGDIPGGNWREAIQRSTHSIPSPDPSIPSRSFALTVKGDSMDKWVDDGGTIIIDPDDKSLFSGKFYAILNGEGETTFKQYFETPSRLTPCSTNPSHQDILIGSEPIEVIGRIIWRAARM